MAARRPNTTSSSSSFADLGVPASLVRTLTRQGITAPFPIQTATLPDSLAGRDVLGRGRTGSGKTYAFVLPLLARLAASKTAPQARPPARADPRAHPRAGDPDRQPRSRRWPRHLALPRLTIFGGVGARTRRSPACGAGVDIVVACPGRLEDHVQPGPRDARRGRDHRPRRGRPHGRPRLPAGGRALLDQHARRGQRMLFSATLDAGVDVLVQALPHQPGDPQRRLGAVARRHDDPPRAARAAATDRLCRCSST